MATVHTNKPLDNLTYDIVSIIHEKSQALEAYDDYMEDAQSDPEVAQLIDDIRRHDEEDVQRLRFELGRLLGKSAPQGAPSPEVGRAI
jgi:hypothetical protein